MIEKRTQKKIHNRIRDHGITLRSAPIAPSCDHDDVTRVTLIPTQFRRVS